MFYLLIELQSEVDIFSLYRIKLIKENLVKFNVTPFGKNPVVVSGILV